MRVRAILGSLQLPVAGVGAVVFLGSVAAIASLPPSPEGEGFVRGLAVLVLFVGAWAGFVVTAFGLAIPPGEDGVGVQFSRGQRLLLLAAGGLGLASAVAPLVFWAVVVTVGLSPGTATLAWFALMGIAVVALLAGVGWRAAEAAAPRLGFGWSSD